MNYVLGLIVATGAILAALTHLDQGLTNYYDFVAMAMVIGGTFAVSLIVFPWSLYKLILKNFGKLILSLPPNRKQFISQCLSYLKMNQSGQKVNFKKASTLQDQILKDGFELIELGFSHKKIKDILSQRIHEHGEFSYKVSGAIRSLAKYPPAFGLAGTVFGVAELMRAVAEGLPAQETGLKMAIALVATLYGILVSNMFINPAGEQIQKISENEMKMAEMSLVSVLLAKDNVNLLECQESLNSFVLPNERVNILDQVSDHSGAA